MLMRHCVDLWPSVIIRLVNHRVRKAVEVEHPKTSVTVRPAVLILDQEITYSFELRKESFRDSEAGMRCVVHSGFA
jgi:hypothetical protein